MFLDPKNNNRSVVVWDPFCGTGSTGVAVDAIRCQFVGTDYEVINFAKIRVQGAYIYSTIWAKPSSNSSTSAEDNSEQDEGCLFIFFSFFFLT